jgi:anaphase-promoting complex subunit 4
MAMRLSLFSETELEHRAIEGFPISCPTLDLSASWDSASKNLLVYRPLSQAVSKIHQVGLPGAKAPEVLTATWKADGKYLCLKIPFPEYLYLIYGYRSVFGRWMDGWRGPARGTGK